MISDCFDKVEALTAALKRMRHARHEVILLQVVAPEEETFPFRSPTQFRSLEKSGHRMLVDPHRLRKIYVEQYREFCEALQKQCTGMGIDRLKITTADPYQKVLGAFLDSRSRLR